MRRIELLNNALPIPNLEDMILKKGDVLKIELEVSIVKPSMLGYKCVAENLRLLGVELVHRGESDSTS